MNKDNKIMGIHPILIIVLIILISIFGFQKVKNNSNDSTLPLLEIEKTELQQNSVLEKIKSLMPFIDNNMSKISTAKPNLINKLTLDEIPEIPSNEPTINTELLKKASQVKNIGQNLIPIELSGIGRRDPMRPVYVNDVKDLEMYDKEFLFYSTAEKDEFYLITEDILGSNKEENLVTDTSNSDESNNTSLPNNTIIIKYKDWFDAIQSGKKPSVKAQQYNIDKLENQTLNSELIDESIDYFKGLTPNKIILKYVYTNNKNQPTATFYGVGGNFEDLKENEYLAGIYYIEDIDVDDKTVTLSFKYGDLLVKKIFKRNALYEYNPSK